MNILPWDFWDKVWIGDECWEWRGCRNRLGGYGRLSIDGQRVLAHRVAWEMEQGPVPDGIRVLHRCDNPPCVRPDHLFLGTQADNIADMRAKGREAGRKGNRNGRAILTAEDIAEMRVLRGLGWTWPRLGGRFGVARTTAQAALSGQNWGHLS
jgi:hypothetical protein